MAGGLAWRLLIWLAIGGVSAWGGMALYFRGPRPAGSRRLLIAGWLAAGAVTVAVSSTAAARPVQVPALAVYACLVAVLLAWWCSIRASHHRDWAPDVARLLDYDSAGECVTLYNVRNFEWRTPTDYTPHWEQRHYDLSRLATIDLIVSYWRGPWIAHTLVSFGFTDGRQLVFSVEVRRTREQTFSTLGGFFKQCELAIVAADERDIVRTRSNIRGEAVYVYRVAMPVPAIRALFVAYLRQAGALGQRPRFYNTLFSNCTTLVFAMVRRIVPGLPRDSRLIRSGYLPHYIYDLDALDTSRPFAELERRGHINERALASDRDDPTGRSFSSAIRRGVPRPDGRLIAPDSAE